MSVSHPDVILRRIRGAAECSPIAVFRTNGWPAFDAVFASTVRTAQLVRQRPATLVGVFHGGDDPERVRDLLGAMAEVPA